MTDDFPPYGKARESLIQKLIGEAEDARRNGRPPPPVMLEHHVLIEETAGQCFGNVYILFGNKGHLVWSPEWRSDVPPENRMTHVGAIGQSTCIGWSNDAGIAPIVISPRCLGAVGTSIDDVEELLLKSGIKVRPRSEPSPPSEMC